MSLLELGIENPIDRYGSPERVGALVRERLGIQRAKWEAAMVTLMRESAAGADPELVATVVVRLVGVDLFWSLAIATTGGDPEGEPSLAPAG